MRTSKFPSEVRFGETDWLARKVVLGEEVQALSYHPAMEVYVLGTSQKVDFRLPEDDDFHHEWKGEGILILECIVTSKLCLRLTPTLLRYLSEAAD